jgi:hypothetical protein
MSSPVPPAVPPELLRQAVDDGIRRYFASRRARVRPFVDRHFSLRGSAAVHRAALGWDIARAPANILLAGPHAGLKAAASLARRAGARRFGEGLSRRSLLLKTDVGRQIEWLICTELLELPCVQGARVAARDALVETILDDPRLQQAARAALQAVGQRAQDAAFRARLAQAMTTYAATRAAAAEIATSLLTLGSGALAVKQLTPGVATLAPALAGVLAQQAAIASFPLGAGLGGLWYGLFPAAPSLALTAGLAGGMALAASAVAAFAGLVTDPLQRRLGLHERRLLRLIDALERQMLDPAAPGYTVHDHYVARLMDLFDILGCAWRLAHG